MRWSTFTVIFLAVVVSGSENATSRVAEVGSRDVAMLVGQVVRQHLVGCHLVLATTAQHSTLLHHISRDIHDAAGDVVVQVRSFFALDKLSQDHLLQGLWGEAKFLCRALVLHLTDNHHAIRFFEVSGLWQKPKTRVVVVGGRSEMEAFLYHSSLRNTVHALYLALRPHKDLTLNTRLRRPTLSEAWIADVEVYRRCLYCNNGEMDVQLLYRWHPTSGLQDTGSIFTEALEDFMGHMFQIIAVDETYKTALKRDNHPPGTPLMPLDSLDIRILKAFAAQANFTFQIREPLDRQWGVQREDGSWTGIVHVLQHQQADFCLTITPTVTRSQVIQFTSLYMQAKIVIISLKPRLLPQHLAIVRPFPGALWVVLSISILLWSIAIWLIQKARSWVLGGSGVHLSSAFFHSWTALMRNCITDLPVNDTGRLLVGLLLVSCLIITTAYRSSLVAHLIVQHKDAEINTLQDLLSRDGWSWGTNRKGTALSIYFEETQYPSVKKIADGMQYAPLLEEQIRRVLEGGYSYITFKSDVVKPEFTKHTDRRGYTPIHVSRTDYPLFPGNGWAFRIGAPFRYRISQMMERLTASGLIDYWLDDVISKANKVSRNRTDNEEAEGVVNNEIFEADEENRILRMNHLQGAFYLLLSGYGVVCLVLLGEKLAYSFSTSQ